MKYFKVGQSMRRVAIILAGGFSKRFGENKALVEVKGKPMIMYVIEACIGLALEIMTVVNDRVRYDALSNVLPSFVKLVIDDKVQFPNVRSPIVGLATGLKNTEGDYAVALSCDAPLVNPLVIKYLFHECEGRDAAIPIWPNGNIEPLQAVYRAESALKATEETIKSGERDFRSMIKRLREVLFVPTRALQKFDPGLNTFLNVNSPEDLAKIVRLL